MTVKKFDQYFLMREPDVVEYIQRKYDYFSPQAELSVKEIGDGNLNYVFRVQEDGTGKSIIVKHSGIETRAKSGRLINVDRNRIEAEILMMQEELAPGMVPRVFDYDTVMCCMIMEDLKDYEVMRKTLLEQKTFPFFADQITTFLVNTLLESTDIVMSHKKKKENVSRFQNPDLCDITEQLVYSEPFGNFSGKNYVVEGMDEFVQSEIYLDIHLRLEVAKLKFAFMEHAQALLHGDLHSGSIFINEQQIKVFDPEFAFYGPMGYDLANVIAHLLFAKFYSIATYDNKKADAFQKWVDYTVLQIVDLFIGKFIDRYDEVVTDDMAKTEGYKEYYLNQIISDTAGILGCELIRRIVGVAKVSDLTLIENEEKRADVERRMIKIAKKFIMNRDSIQVGRDFINIIKQFN